MLTPTLGPMTAHLWINDGLMALFSLTIGLEIKREWIDGRLASWDRRALPFIAAIAGMAAPALLYLGIAGHVPGLAKGWAIPAATDIAFALGILALLGPRVPTAPTLLLTTIAIMDDMGAIAIIAIAYTASLNNIALAAAAVVLAVMFALNRRGVRSRLPYLIGFACLWYAVLLSGVHATLSGVVAAMAMPVRTTPGAHDAADSTHHRLEQGLHPWSALLIVPVFGFANAGVELPANMGEALVAPLPLAIATGLFIGKKLGIFVAIRIAVTCRIAARPRGTTWLQIYGMAMLCGIGFTMSLFIGTLAFPGHPTWVEEAKIGILAGSLLSALLGLLLLRLAPLHSEHATAKQIQTAEVYADGDVPR
ncbi:Na+/H+ antiporter NhaA [Sphingobium sufflavum]|uniref:Na+/H+ antiporter NhaA n=1 Tax=Sphingobium sufflavum TaxID=1129547 RepID=UPI00389A9C43